MKFACLGSGSKGNATVIQAGSFTLMVDCGFSLKETTARLEAVDLSPRDVGALLVTHEHGDHIRGISALSRRFKIPVWTSKGTSHYFTRDDIDLQVINVHAEFQIGELKVRPVPVPHDAREPCQFIFRTEDYCLGILTDVGSITPHIMAAYRDCEAMLLEFNHDRNMLMNGDYPLALKHRIGCELGHLSNAQSCALLQALLPGELKFIVAGHLSESNNSPEIVEAELSSLRQEHDYQFEIAAQHAASRWYELAAC